MEDAILTFSEDGKPILKCSCGSELGFIKDHDTIIYEGETYTQFVKYCSKGKCSLISHYETLHTVDSRKVFVFPQDKIKKVVSEDSKTKIKEYEE
jgi:hypothetical protein